MKTHLVLAVEEVLASGTALRTNSSADDVVRMFEEVHNALLRRLGVDQLDCAEMGRLVFARLKPSEIVLALIGVKTWEESDYGTSSTCCQAVRLYRNDRQVVPDVLCIRVRTAMDPWRNGTEQAAEQTQMRQ